MINTEWDGWAVLDRWLKFHLWNWDYISGASPPHVILNSLHEISVGRSNTAAHPLWLKLEVITLNYSLKSCLLRIHDWKLESCSLILFLQDFWKVEAWDQIPCLIISVKKTPVTLAFEDDADRVECVLNTSVLISVIARTCPNHLEAVEGGIGLCGLICLTRNWLLQPIKHGLICLTRNWLLQLSNPPPPPPSPPPPRLSR